MLVGTVQRDSSAYYKKFIPDDFNMSKSTSAQIRALNPILTDETMRLQTDLNHIFSQHPDISGLSLLLDDSSKEERLSTVSIEDFLPPKDHYDIFDIEEFIESSKSQFRKLPVEFRMLYNNDPMQLISALENQKTSSETLAALSDILKPLMPGQTPIQSSETATVDNASKSSDNAASKVDAPNSTGK